MGGSNPNGGHSTSDRFYFSKMGTIAADFDASVLTQPAPDRDADGFADVDDPCPNFAGPNGGCRPNPLPTLQGDMIGDDRLDLFAFYKYDGNVTGLWAWDGADLSGTARKLWQSGKWNTDKVIPAGVGDVDGNGKVELFAFFAYADNRTALFMWSSTSLGATVEKVWESTAWGGDRTIPAGVADVDGDDLAEVFAFYGTGRTSCRPVSGTATPTGAPISSPSTATQAPPPGSGAGPEAASQSREARALRRRARSGSRNPGPGRTRCPPAWAT